MAASGHVGGVHGTHGVMLVALPVLRGSRLAEKEKGLDLPTTKDANVLKCKLVM